MKRSTHVVVDNPFLSEGGEMGRLMRCKNWSETSLGPLALWPQSLRTVVSVCLSSTFPVLIWWGKDLVNLYNDSFQPIVGEEKHPWALGAPGKQVWVEIWDVVAPKLERAYDEGKPAWSEHQLLLLRRHGYTEECYFTFSHSPIRDESGAVGGVFTAVTETTREVISARRSNTLGDLAGSLILKKDEADIYQRALQVIQKNDKDFPFVLIYSIDSDGRQATLVARTHERPGFAEVISSESDDDDPWGIWNVVESCTETIIEDLSGFSDLPSGAWQKKVKKVLLLPVFQTGRPFSFAVMVVGLNPYRIIDNDNLGFYTLFAHQMANEIAHVRDAEYRRQSVHSSTGLGKVRKRAEDFVRDVFEQAPIPMCFLKGAELYIEQANAYMLRFWGRRSEEVLHKPVDEAFPELREQGFLAKMQKVFQTGERFRAEEVPVHIWRHGKLEHRFISFVYEPFKETDGEVTAIVVVGYDVTQLVAGRKDAQRHADAFEQQISARTAELRNKNEELELKNAELEQFNFLASHDLQEPLRKIQTFSGLMLYNVNDHILVEKYVHKIVGSVARMSVLIQSLLDYSRLSQAKHPFAPVDLNEVLRAVIEDFELIISEKHCAVKSAGLPTVHGDRRQLGQLFSSLIHNAFKFCNLPPEVEISWHTLDDCEKEALKLPVAKSFICLQFSDNGIGFDPHYEKRVFEMFKRMHSPTEYPGAGIGLAFCKKIVENHGGIITAESKVGEGSRFRVYLPA